MRDMSDPAARPTPGAVTRATYTRRVYRPALIILWVMMVIAIVSLFLGFPLVTFFFIIPSVAGNFVLSRRVQRDLTEEITAELICARIRVARSASRVTALESLLDVVWLLEHELRRPVTLRDLLSGADAAEQARRMRLVRALRLPAPNDGKER